MKRMLFVLFAVALAAIPVFAQPKAASKSTIQGVWRIVEVTTTGEKASVNKTPQPSQYIFTAKHYSLIRVNGTEPRPELPDDSKATAAELLTVYGIALTAQSGTYELKDGKLTTRAIVAKFPGAMAATTFNTYSYKLDGSTLTLTHDSSNAGPVTNPTTWKLSRIE